MKCSEYNSRKIRTLSFLASVGVVLLHTNPLANATVGAEWLRNVGLYFSWFNIWCVPYFFLVSGFFFDRGRAEKSGGQFFWGKIKSLAIPYLLWGAAWGALVWTPLWFLTNIKNGLPITANTIFESTAIFSIIDRLFGVMRLSPANPTLWFVRMLMIIFAISPVLWWFRRRAMPIFLLCSIAGICLLTPVAYVTPAEKLFEIFGFVFSVKLQAIAWFCLGMCMSAFKCDERNLSVWTTIILAAIAIVCMFYKWVAIYPLFAIAVIWKATDAIMRFVPQQLPLWMSMSFWIYCCHGPVSGWMNALFKTIFGTSSLGYAFSSATMWFVTVCICLSGAYLCRRFFPKTYMVLSGGRG